MIKPGSVECYVPRCPCSGEVSPVPSSQPQKSGPSKAKLKASGLARKSPLGRVKSPEARRPLPSCPPGLPPDFTVEKREGLIRFLERVERFAFLLDAQEIFDIAETWRHYFELARKL